MENVIKIKISTVFTFFATVNKKLSVYKIYQKDIKN